MRAIISDLHSNQEALNAVFRHIESLKNVTEIVCLGDIIGYGPNPREAIRVVMDRARWCIRGNHEDALLFIAADFNMEAATSIDWTRNQLNSREHDKSENHRFWNYLGDLTDRVEENGFLYVHGSPRMPTREYVRPADANDKERMKEIFDLIDHVCFVGHTHEPGVITEDYRFLFPKLLNFEYRIGKGKCLINVGSVGQPRDRDPRACYMTVDGDLVRWHRIEYDFTETMKKIIGTGELPHHLAHRLREGR